MKAEQSSASVSKIYHKPVDQTFKDQSMDTTIPPCISGWRPTNSFGGSILIPYKFS